MLTISAFLIRKRYPDRQDRREAKGERYWRMDVRDFRRGCRRETFIGSREVWHFGPDAIYPYCICRITVNKHAAKTVAVLVFKFDR
jgi:hypothetical protein